MVSSIRGEGSVIVDPLGRVLAKSSSYNPAIFKTLNLDYEVLHLDYNHEKLVEVKRKYGSKVEVDVSRPEAVFIFASNVEGKSVGEIAAEFNIETRSRYFNRSNRVRADALRKSVAADSRICIVAAVFTFVTLKGKFHFLAFYDVRSGCKRKRLESGDMLLPPVFLLVMRP